MVLLPGDGIGVEVIAADLTVPDERRRVEERLGDDRDRVYPVNLSGNDKGSGFVVGVGRSRADCSYEGARIGIGPGIPIMLVKKGHKTAAAHDRAVEKNMGIDADKRSIVVGVAIARPGHAGPDVTHDRTRIAANLVVRSAHLETSFAIIAARIRSGVAGVFARRIPTAW